MTRPDPAPCPECGESTPAPDSLDRRHFLRTVGGQAAALVVLGSAAPRLLAADTPKLPAKPTKPAEELVKELMSSLSTDQKTQVILPWDWSEKGKKTPARLGMYNKALDKTIGDVYTKPQQELVERILRAVASDDEGFRRLTRNGTYDGSGTLQMCGANVFGDPADGKKWSWVFTGHHLTVRCDGNSEEGAAFGGPMYYGHSPNGYSDKNCFYYQTKAVLSVFDALSGTQRQKAVVQGSPGEGEGSIKFRSPNLARPGISYAELTRDQRALVVSVMREVLSPFRKEDGDEVMQIVKATGGMDKVHLAFYQDGVTGEQKPWTFWRLEGPGFVWNYRVLPHVHTYVNISTNVG